MPDPADKPHVWWRPLWSRGKQTRRQNARVSRTLSEHVPPAPATRGRTDAPLPEGWTPAQQSGGHAGTPEEREGLRQQLSDEKAGRNG